MQLTLGGSNATFANLLKLSEPTSDGGETANFKILEKPNRQGTLEKTFAAKSLQTVWLNFYFISTKDNL